MPDVRSASTSAAPDSKQLKPILPIQRRLRISWVCWLVYRLLVLPTMIALLTPQHLDIIGGIAWQALWLIPAFVMTPAILRGESAYALLISSMFTLIYLGASGVVLFTRVYAVDWSVLWIYGSDGVLLLLINIWLFLLLKRLPSMNKSLGY